MLFKRWTHRLFLAGMVLALAGACSASVGESWPGLSTDGRYVYVAYNEQVFRIDSQAANDPPNSTTRHIDWLTQAPNKPHFYAPPALSDAALYVGAFDSKVYAFDAKKGGALPGWVIPTADGGKLAGTATLDNNILYQGMGTNGLRAYNPLTGQELAKYVGTKYGVWGAPLVEGDTVYFTSLDHNLYAVTAGTLLYKWQIDVGGVASDSPVYADGILYVGTSNNEVVAVDTTQTPPAIVRRFTTETANGWVWGTPLLDQGVLYFGDLNGTLYAIDAKTFTLKWKQVHPDDVGGFRGRLALVTDAHPNGSANATRLIIGGSENKRVYAYDEATGALDWTSALVMNDKVLSNMLVIKSEVVFATQDENQLVVALNIDRGNLDWQVSLTNEKKLITPTAQP